MFAAGLLAAVFDAQAARDIDGDGLGEVDVLAGRDGGGRLLRVEVRRAVDRHGVHLLQQLQVALEAREAIGLRDLQLLAGVVHAVLEVVGHGDDVVAAVLLEQLGDPGAAPAAADQAEIDLGIGGRAADETRLHHGERHGGGPRPGHESPAGQ